MKKFKVIIFRLNGAQIAEEHNVSAASMLEAREQFFNRFPSRCVYCIQVKP